MGRDYLEKSVESLKRKLLKDSDVHRQDNMRILQENVARIREINDLRREINYLKHERQQQRLNVSKLGSTGGSKAIGAESMQGGTTQEIDENKQTIADLRMRIEEQAQLRESAAADLAGSGAEG